MKPTFPASSQMSLPSLYDAARIIHTFDVRKQTLVLGAVGDETLEGSSNHGVLAHQHHGFASQVRADFVHLLRRDIVDADLVDLSVRSLI